jgi:hypothetical protein
MEFLLQLAFVLACLFYGARKGGMALGLLGGMGPGLVATLIVDYFLLLPKCTPPFNPELRGLRKSGSVFPLQVHGRRTELAGDIGLMGTLVGNTERKRAEEARARRAIVAMAAAVVLTLYAATSLLLKRLLRTPITRLEAMVDRLGAGDLEAHGG